MISWKFLKKCANGKMGIYGRSWRDVTQDPRFKVGRGDTENDGDNKLRSAGGCQKDKKATEKMMPKILLYFIRVLFLLCDSFHK